MATIKMDWIKNLLIAAMLAVLLLLFIRWNEFQEQHAPKLDTSSSQSSLTASSVPSAAEVPTVEGTDGSIPSPTSTDAIVSRVITVKTDTFNMAINTLGGDIVSVSLPKFLEKQDTPDRPFVLLDNRENHIYVAQSGLIGANGTDRADGSRPIFSAEQTHYELADNANELQVDLELKQGDVTITKRFTFTRGDYLVKVDYLIDNQATTPWYGQLYGQIKRDSKNFVAVNFMQMNPFLGVALTTNESNYKKYSFDDISKGNVTEIKEGGFVAMVQHYFVSAWIPNSKSENTYRLRKLSNQDAYLFGFTSPQTEVAPGSQGVISASFYAGPKDTQRLEEISPYLDLTVDYGWLWWIAKPLFWLLKFIHGFVGNWGLAIIGLTIVVKAVFFKLSATSYRSMAKMRKLQPKMTELKERYGEDRQRFSQEMMKLYKTEGVNPFGGCLPILIQMPVFIALYWVLMESFELRHAPFFGWITDLSVKDPYLVLPLLYGASMWFMQKLNPQPTDPMQAKIMNMLPFIFTFMFLWFPAGLVLYWLTNNVLSIAQQYVITRNIEKEDVKA